MVRWVVGSILHRVDPLEGTRLLAHHQLQQVHIDRLFSFYVRWVVRSILHGVDSLEGTRSLAHHQLQQVHIDRLFSFYVRWGCQINPSWGGLIGGDPFASTPPATTGTRDSTFLFLRSFMVRWVVGSILHGGDPFASTPPATTGTRDSTFLFLRSFMVRWVVGIDPSWGGPVR